MSNPTRIYLQPECCVNEHEGRLWCETPDPEDCEDGKRWARYFSEEAVQKAIEEEVADWTLDKKRAVRLALQSVWAKLDTIYT